MAGLTATGFVPETFEEIVAGMEADEFTELAMRVRGDASILGRINKIFANRIVSCWEATQAVYAAGDPNGAVKAALSALCALTGTVGPKPATGSTATLTLTGTPATAVALGSQGSSSTGGVFATDAEATIAALTAWATATGYVVGDRVTSGGDAWQCSIAGTSAGSGSLDSTGLSPGDTLADNTATWIFMGAGAGAVDAAATATETGPTVALAYDITTIDTPVSGWDAVVNMLDATEGADLETDEALRIRREIELAAAGTGPTDAIRADILKVTGVTSCRVFENVTNVTDADGVPAKSVEILVQGGADQDIWDQVWLSVDGGIQSYGTEIGTATDSEGNAQTVAFSRPTEKDIYVDVILTKDPLTYPADGDTQIKTAIVAFGDAQSPGKDVVASRVSAACFGVTGVLDVTTIEIIKDAGPPVASTTIVISDRELAVYDTSRITVDSTTDGEP